MNHFEKVFRCFPLSVQQQIEGLPEEIRNTVEEIRVYRGKPVQIFAGGRRFELCADIESGEIHGLLNNLMKFSYYAYEEDIAKGFITIDGGHRVGICGKAVVEKGRVTMLKDISSLNIRYSREIPGCSDSLLRYLIKPDGSLCNMLIISPPGCGKTTLLRDIARNLSMRDYKVAICDERSEIAGMASGVSPYTFGTMVDVLDACPKAEGMRMLVRSMSPNVVIADEIGTEDDAEAVKNCIFCGVSVVTTIHGASFEDLSKTDLFEMAEKHIFDYLVFLSDKPSAGTVKEVCRG